MVLIQNEKQGVNRNELQHEFQLGLPFRPYALAKLEEAARAIKQSVTELPAIRKRLDKNKDNKPKASEVYKDLQQQHGRLLGALSLSALSLLEMELPDEADYSVKLSQSVKAFNLMTLDYSKLCMALSGYLDKLPVINQPVSSIAGSTNLIDPTGSDSSQPELQTTNASIIGRLMNNVKMGYYPTDLEHVGYLARGIDFPEGITVNLLDPCCGCGLALRALVYGDGDGVDGNVDGVDSNMGRADGNTDRVDGNTGEADGNASVADNQATNRTNCLTYGIELDGHRAEEALTRLDRVGFGTYFRSRISREAFHLMLLNPPYISVMTEGGNNTRSEKRFLVDSIGHLLYGGLLIYIIPHYRMTADICRILCDNFEDLTVWKFSGDEFKRFKQLAVMGIRRKRH